MIHSVVLCGADFFCVGHLFEAAVADVTRSDERDAPQRNTMDSHWSNNAADTHLQREALYCYDFTSAIDSTSTQVESEPIEPRCAPKSEID